MSAQGSSAPQEASEYLDKGKGKQVESFGADAMDEDESESEESGAEQAEEEEDGLEDIDLDNITASRTRGKQIDWAEAEMKAKEAGDDLDDEDDDDDDDFEAPEEISHEDRMEE